MTGLNYSTWPVLLSARPGPFKQLDLLGPATPLVDFSALFADFAPTGYPSPLSKHLQ